MKSPVMGCFRLRYEPSVVMYRSQTEGAATSGASSSTAQSKNPKTKEIWVQPKEEFMNLLKTVGAKGSRFTEQEVMSFLIKYISSRRLFDQQDPKKVYCSTDPLGDVFGVEMFTIRDARRLLFENLTLLNVSSHSKAIPGENPSLHYTLFQQSIKQRPPNLESQITDLSAAGRLPAKRGRTSSSSTTPSSVQSKRPKRRKKRPKPKHRKDHPDGTANQSRGSTSTAAPAQAGKAQQLVQLEQTLEHPTQEGARPGKRPWYCIVYTSSEDLQSKSSEVLSVQDNETIEAHDSSDDLWFLEEDAFAVEFEVGSSSSSGTPSQEDTSNDDSESTDKGDMEEEIIVDLKVMDSSDSRQGDYSSALDTDEELSEADKWRCMECNAKNTPICRYCFRCMAVRSAWLPDEQRMTLWERLHHHQGYPMQRASSAPASNLPQVIPASSNQVQSNTSSPMRGSPPQRVTPPIVDVSDGKRTDHNSPMRMPANPPTTGQSATPCSSIPQVGTPLRRNSPENVSSPQQSLAVSGMEAAGQDEAGHSSDSSGRGLGNRSPRGPGSQSTASPPEEPLSTQSPMKRPWAVSSSRKDSGLGQSLRTQSSQGTSTIEGSLHVILSSKDVPNQSELRTEAAVLDVQSTASSSREAKRHRLEWAAGHQLLETNKGQSTRYDSRGTGHSHVTDIGSSDWIESESLRAHQKESSLQSVHPPGGSAQAPSGSAQAPSGFSQAPSGSAQALSGFSQAPSGSILAPSGTPQSHLPPNQPQSSEVCYTQGPAISQGPKNSPLLRPVVSHPPGQISLQDTRAHWTQEPGSSGLQMSRSHHPRTKAHGHQHSAERSLPRTSSLDPSLGVRPPTSPMASPSSGSSSRELCMVCMSGPRKSVIIHGETGHLVCCSGCAKKLKRRNKPCPVCRKPIEKVIRVYW